MSDQLAAYVRTLWPIALGYLATQVVTWAARTYGIDLDGSLVLGAITTILSAVVYAAGRWLESRAGGSWPAVLARFAGRWLLSLGLRTGQPTYVGPASR